MRAAMTLLEQIQRDEGCRLTVYLDSRGVPTIGWGRNLRDKGISQKEADAMLKSDLADVTKAVTARWPWMKALDDARRAVFLNMAYNLGVQGLGGFVHALAAAERGDYPIAAADLLNSNSAGQG